MRITVSSAALFAVFIFATGSPQAAPYSQPGVDAPELAPLGAHGVGVRSITLVERAVPDVLAYDKAKGSAPLKDRTLLVDVWYPAAPGAHGASVVYSGSLPSETGPNAAFTVDGVALRDAPADRRQTYPLVVMAHGYSGTPAMMAWLGENLASKGYVVAAAHHEDPPITNMSAFMAPVLLRPLDIAFLAHTLQAMAKGADPMFSSLIDPGRVALIGYSMGGYGATTVAGAALSPTLAAQVPGGALTPYALGGAKADELHVDGLKALVAISPAGGNDSFHAWDAAGLAKLTTPSLFIVGDQDKVVGYAPGVKSIFEGAVNAPRYLLVFKNGAHSIGANGAPDTMRAKLWNEDWFEDPVWRKERVIGVNLHMITAFLDLYVKGDQSRAAYLDLIPQSNDGVWPVAKTAPYAAFSPGSGGVTVWKGFQRVHSAGLELHHAEPASSR
jgi:predicted dienelactone hydrolase